jgi:hypothetical protein
MAKNDFDKERENGPADDGRNGAEKSATPSSAADCPAPAHRQLT